LCRENAPMYARYITMQNIHKKTSLTLYNDTNTEAWTSNLHAKNEWTSWAYAQQQNEPHV